LSASDVITSFAQHVFFMLSLVGWITGFNLNRLQTALENVLTNKRSDFRCHQSRSLKGY